MKTIYEYMTRRVVFEGTEQECVNWLMSKAFTFKDGRKLYRTWKENDDTVYDVGSLYIFNK